MSWRTAGGGVCARLFHSSVSGEAVPALPSEAQCSADLLVEVSKTGQALSLHPSSKSPASTLVLAPNSGFLLMQSLGGSGDGLANWVPATHMGDWDGVPGSWLWL